MAAVLEINNVSKTFDGVKAVDGLSLAVEEHQIASLIGPNGAGKTTLFNLICGFLHSDGGSIVFRGKALDGMGPHHVARLGVGRTFQDLRLIRKVSVLDNIMLGFQNQAGEGVLHSLRVPRPRPGL